MHTGISTPLTRAVRLQTFFPRAFIYDAAV
jgi:hypothetical protein